VNVLVMRMLQSAIRVVQSVIERREDDETNTN
jgi:hypothetical protein